MHNIGTHILLHQEPMTIIYYSGSISLRWIKYTNDYRDPSCRRLYINSYNSAICLVLIISLHTSTPHSLILYIIMYFLFISHARFVGSLYIRVLLIITIIFPIVRTCDCAHQIPITYNIIPIFPLQKCNACCFLHRWLQLLIRLQFIIPIHGCAQMQRGSAFQAESSRMKRSVPMIIICTREFVGKRQAFTANNTVVNG